MATSTPVFTDNVEIFAPFTLNNNAGSTFIKRGTIDLRTKYGAYIQTWIGRKGTTAPGSPIEVALSRVLNNDATSTVGGDCGDHQRFYSNINSINSTTVNTDSNSGQNAVNVASATGFVHGDSIVIYDSGFTRLEFCRVAKQATGVLTVEKPLTFSHTAAQADNVVRSADIFPAVWCPGGALWQVVFDYGATGTGSDAVVYAKAQTYDSESST